jgi:hypothetical protein
MGLTKKYIQIAKCGYSNINPRTLQNTNGANKQRKIK